MTQKIYFRSYLMRPIFMALLGMAFLSGNIFAQGADAAVDLAMDTDGTVFVTGSSMETTGYVGYVLITYDAQGNRKSVVRTLATDGGSSIPAAVAIDESGGNIILTGTSPEASTGYDIVTMSFSKSSLVSVEYAPVSVSGITLSQSYPNPVTNDGTARINYTLPSREDITLTVVNLAGEKIADLDYGVKEPGSYTVTFSPKDLPAGTYFYSLQSLTSSQIKKLAVIR
jgi:type IX secretion system substrate protein